MRAAGRCKDKALLWGISNGLLGITNYRQITFTRWESYSDDIINTVISQEVKGQNVTWPASWYKDWKRCDSHYQPMKLTYLMKSACYENEVADILYNSCFTLRVLGIYLAFTFTSTFLGPFHGAIAVPSVTRCRCRGHRYAGGARQYR